MRSSSASIYIGLIVVSIFAPLVIPASVHVPKDDGEYETLDADGNYLVAYSLDGETITFSVLVHTTGFVGFGLSMNGAMTGADIVIGGVAPDGAPYFTDRHGVGKTEPVLDESQDWTLIDAWENGTHTHLRFERSLDTCDKSHDLPITRDTVSLIWSYGRTDTISYHGESCGVSSVNLLDSPMPPFEPEKYDFWKMTVTQEMPAEETTYHCSTQRSPLLSAKKHIVAFRPYLAGPDALKHTHHFIVHKCRAPEGQDPDEYFRPYLEGPGGACYKGSPNVPLRDCMSYLYVWAIGGKTMVLPDHVGYPIGEQGGYEYYMLEVHYDNPHKLQGLRFETGLEIYYTDQLRSQEAGTLTLGHKEAYSLTIPPNVTDFVVAGHCAKQCSDAIPDPGINVFNILLHSHLAGRKLKLRHFRDNVELPWLAVDNNYNFDYQQNRPLVPEGKIMPGDHLTLECTYDSTAAKQTVIGGLSSREEMCDAFLLYYPKMPLEICQTEYAQGEVLREFGIESIAWDTVSDPIVLAPEHMAGKTYSEVLNTMVDWNPNFLAEFQYRRRFGGMTNRCRGPGLPTLVTDTVGQPRTDYPVTDEEYAPPDTCTNSNFHPSKVEHM